MATSETRSKAISKRGTLPPLEPGDRLDPLAFFAVDGKRVRETLSEGLGTARYAEFVERLREA